MGHRSKIIKISDFYAKKLNNYRDIFIYLPEGYDADTELRYPVLYMHDGQNIFSISNKSLSGCSWNIDYTADELIRQGKIKKIIIVGVSNNTSRGGEYTHFSCINRVVKGGALGDYKLSVDGRGLLYEDFIINDLKPYVDSKFRTMSDSENTAMIGSSMGGLVTYNIGFRNPGIFGKLGIMSPAFFWEDLKSLSSVQKAPLKIWMDVGEGEDYFVNYAKDVADVLIEKGYKSGDDFMYYQEPMAIHSELDWGKRVRMPLMYFFGNIGVPESCRLFGDDKTGISEENLRINPVITYDSGFTISQLNGSYCAEHPEVLDVCGDGTILGKSEGTSNVTFTYEGLKISRQYTVVKELSNSVDITINVKVPGKTPTEANVYMGTYVTKPLKLCRIGDKLYQGRFSFPRGLVVSFRFRREADVFGKPDLTLEKDKSMNEIDIRQFRATEDKELFYTVENWGDILP
ncbi:MAG TPA: alpha/beta hydrolase-fold protein [Caproicibacter sp.]|nr:alpha/beta hydrolase-fold protein [Caproicibacter sp.]